MKDTKLNYTLNIIARWFVGLVFLFSSFSKGVDPLGTAFKVQEYMTAWSIGSFTFEWALPLANFLSVTLICAEFVVGVLLLTGSFRRRIRAQMGDDAFLHRHHPYRCYHQQGD